MELKEEKVELKEEETHNQTHPQKSQKLKNKSKQSKKEPRIREEKKESPLKSNHKKENSKEKISSVEKVEEEISKETKEIALETETFEKEKEKEKINSTLECTHKEEFSLEATPSKKDSSSNTNNIKSETPSPFPSQPMYYMYNPMMMSQMNPMDPKGNMSQGYYFYPVFIDPTKMPKDMNAQNMGMFYPPMMPMYPTNFDAQNFMQNSNKK